MRVAGENFDLITLFYDYFALFLIFCMLLSNSKKSSLPFPEIKKFPDFPLISNFPDISLTPSRPVIQGLATNEKLLSLETLWVTLRGQKNNFPKGNWAISKFSNHALFSIQCANVTIFWHNIIPCSENTA